MKVEEVRKGADGMWIIDGRNLIAWFVVRRWCRSRVWLMGKFGKALLEGIGKRK